MVSNRSIGVVAPLVLVLPISFIHSTSRAAAPMQAVGLLGHESDRRSDEARKSGIGGN
jgi:hypothetical protein